MGLIERLVLAQQRPILGRLAAEVLSIYGVEIPVDVKIGAGFILHHRGQGVVITNKTSIAANVVIYQQVTIGRAALSGTDDEVGFEGVSIERGVTLCAGAKILGGRGVLTVGEGSIVAANAVLLQSTGTNEVWAGVPARRVKRLSESVVD